MSDPISPENDEFSEHREKLLESANAASQTVAALHIAFLAFVAYLGVIVWGTSHEDLLRISPVKLPILDVELPLTAFYNFVPWMVVLLHFNLLMQLELLSCKLWNLDRDLPDSAVGQQVRDRLFIFPFTHLIVGRSSVQLIRWLLSLVVGITVIALPLFMLLSAQIRFLPFHDETINWSQRLAIWVDAAMLLALWPLIASPKDAAMEWWQHAGYRLLGYWPASLRYLMIQSWNGLLRIVKRLWPGISWREIVLPPLLQQGTEPKGMIVLFVSVPLIVCLSIVAVIPGSITLQTYYKPIKEAISKNETPEENPHYFEDWLIRHVPTSWLSVAAYHYGKVTCTSLPLAEKAEASILQVMLGSCSWFNLNLFERNLNLKEARLIPKEVALSLLIRATDPNKQVRDSAFKEFDGLNLKNRDLRFANLFGAVLPKADLRHVQLQGAVLLNAKLQGIIGWDKTQLQGAILGGTQLQGAALIEADLQAADLRGANLQGTDLSWSNLQSADLRGADLTAANLQGAKLQGADLRGAKFLGATLTESHLQGANLDYADLRGADLAKADLKGAIFFNSQVQGIDWSQTYHEDILLLNKSKTEWSGHQQEMLVKSLEKLMDTEKFNALLSRMKNPEKENRHDTFVGQTDCYSNDRTFLNCKYTSTDQLPAYLSDVLYPKLIELACSDTAIATGIVRRASEVSEDSTHISGLAAALVKSLNSPSACPGIAALPEQAREKLLIKSRGINRKEN